jgi:hypothetical protein
MLVVIRAKSAYSCGPRHLRLRLLFLCVTRKSREHRGGGRGEEKRREEKRREEKRREEKRRGIIYHKNIV